MALTVRGVLVESAARLRHAGVPSPDTDAAVLLAFALGLPRTRLMLHLELPAEVVPLVHRLVARRAKREPLQHIVGTAPFRGLELAVGAGVFVPRPETELVAGAAIDAARSVADHGRAPVVLDLCAGSGAIGLSVAAEVPGALVHLIEADPRAYDWLLGNIDVLSSEAMLAPAAAVRPRLLDVAALPLVLPELAGAVDVVVSNPPYVPDGAYIPEPEVYQFDPAAALWGGYDGLDVVRQVIEVAAFALRRGGVLVVEHADSQGLAVPALVRAAMDPITRGEAFVEVADNFDLSGRSRYTTARKA